MSKERKVQGFTFPKSVVSSEDLEKDPFTALNKINEYVTQRLDTAQLYPQSVEEKNNISFAEITEELYQLYARKNHDYGNAFTESFDEFGLTTFLVRLGDKYRRLKSLNTKKTSQVNESIEDTVMDIANYAIMTLMELRKRH